ncbi:hypothetical protein MRX96_013158 [Rhipicephalus microplus]
MAAASPSSVAAGPADNDDEVVAELDVYLSKILADKLYLVQYPEKSLDRFRMGGKCTAARVKAGQRMVELDFAIKNDEPSSSKGTRSGTDLHIKIKREPSESDTAYLSVVSELASNANIGQKVMQEALKGVARVKLEPSATDVTEAAHTSAAGQVVADNVVVKTQPAEAMAQQVKNMETPPNVEAGQSKHTSTALPDTATNLISEPGPSYAVGSFMQAEPGSSKVFGQPMKVEPSTSGPTGPMYAKIKTQPQDTGTSSHCARVMTLRDTYTMTSMVPISCPENYAVGLLLPGELHLTPLHAIVHMAPVHCCRQESQSSKRVGSSATLRPAPMLTGCGAAANNGPQAPDNDPMTPPDHYVEEETSNGKRCKRFRQERSTQVQHEGDGEPWVEATFHNCSSETSLFERERLVGPRDENPDSSRFFTDEKQYLARILANDPTGRQSDDTVNPIDAGPQRYCSPKLSMRVIERLPLEERINAILVNAKVVRFAKLISILPETIKEQAVIDILPYVAVLVQGCWVVKSEELYPRKGFSEKTGVRAETLCKARDLLLYKYTKARHVKMSTFTETLRKDLCALPAEDVNAILEGISRPTRDGWEFLLPYDADFANAYPDVVLKQQEEWDKRHDALSRTFHSSVMARLQKRPASQGDSSSKNGGGRMTFHRRITPKPLLSSRRSSSGSPAAKLSKRAN